MKVACTVLEGESGGNPADLLRLDDASCIADCLEELYKQIRQHPYDGL